VNFHTTKASLYVLFEYYLLSQINPLLLRIFIFLLLSLVTWSASGQDVAFSQYYAAPSLLNPALIGGSGGQFRLTAINRDQWGNVLDNSFQTFGAAIDVRFKQGTSGDLVGAGVSFFKDKVVGNIFQLAFHLVFIPKT